MSGTNSKVSRQWTNRKSYDEQLRRTYSLRVATYWGNREYKKYFI